MPKLHLMIIALLSLTILHSPVYATSTVTVANINLDMLSQGGSRHKLFVAGTRSNEQLKSIVNDIKEQVNTSAFRLVKGHDRRSRFLSSTRINWTKASDHGPFLRKKIPYLYFGVDTHEHYHTSHDTYENISPDFYINAANTILHTTLEIDNTYQ